MRNLIAVVVLALAASACAITGGALGVTPEAQIVNGANAAGAAAALGTTLLNAKKISVAQAKSYSAILHTASTHLHDADGTLRACRTKTASTAATVPDPCKPGIVDDINLAISVIGDVKKALDSK